MSCDKCPETRLAYVYNENLDMSIPCVNDEGVTVSRERLFPKGFSYCLACGQIQNFWSFNDAELSNIIKCKDEWSDEEDEEDETPVGRVLDFSEDAPEETSEPVDPKKLAESEIIALLPKEYTETDQWHSEYSEKEIEDAYMGALFVLSLYIREAKIDFNPPNECKSQLPESKQFSQTQLSKMKGRIVNVVKQLMELNEQTNGKARKAVIAYVIYRLLSKNLFMFRHNYLFLYTIHNKSQELLRENNVDFRPFLQFNPGVLPDLKQAIGEELFEQLTQ